jgi:hypothetical protein
MKPERSHHRRSLEGANMRANTSPVFSPPQKILPIRSTVIRLKRGLSKSSRFCDCSSATITYRRRPYHHPEL